jgi:hypothetical protein
MSRIAMSHARWTTTHQYTPKHPRKLEDTKLERVMRRILEELSREFDTVSFKSQDGRYDFWLNGVPIDVQGPFHVKQTQRDHDAFKASETIKEGIPPPQYFTEEQLLKHRELVKAFLHALAVLTGSHPKEAA